MKEKILNWVVCVDENKIIQRSTFWNLITSVINAAYSAILMFFIGRIVGMDQVGIFTIAAAYAYQCLSLGAFGVRNVQASDIRKDYSFSDYFYLRVISSIAMYLLLGYYTFCHGYSTDKMAIILSFGIFKSIEAIEDLYHGEYQRYNRLDIGCILQATRYIISLLFFAVMLFITKNLILSFVCSTLLTAIICYIQNVNIIKIYVKEKIQLKIHKVKQLFMICLPICVSNAIATYIVNMPKYAIDKLPHNDIMQSTYGILILPVVTINLLSAVIYRPVVTTLSRNYYDKNYRVFLKIILQQIAVIIVLTMLVIVFGYFIGLRLLEIIYSATLSSEMPAFVVMLIGGGVNTISSFLMIVLTVQRSQNQMLIAYIATLLIALPIGYRIVATQGIMGAAILYLLLSTCITIIFIISIIFSYVRDRKVMCDVTEK